MDLKTALTVFSVVFLAELGDKTQLATFLFASKSPTSYLAVFIGASLALVTATAIAIGAGAFVSQYIDQKMLSYAAGAGFILVGIWTLWRA